MSQNDTISKLDALRAQIETLQSERDEVAKRLAHVVESLDGHWDWKLTEDYEYMDPRFWEIFGYEPHEKEHKPSAWQDMIHPDDLKLALENLEKHIKTKGKVPYHQKVRYTHKLGHTVTVICRGRVVEWGPNGEALRMVGTHTDITAAEQLKETGS